jgi:hypothetical protein
MDPEAFLDMANQVTKLKMYPYFDLAHSAVCLLAIREEMGAGEFELNKKKKKKVDLSDNSQSVSQSVYLSHSEFCGNFACYTACRRYEQCITSDMNVHVLIMQSGGGGRQIKMLHFVNAAMHDF